MLQLPAVNTPQFQVARTRLPHQPMPVPPVFQPEVIARAALHAARHPAGSCRSRGAPGRPSSRRRWPGRSATASWPTRATPASRPTSPRSEPARQPRPLRAGGSRRPRSLRRPFPRAQPGTLGADPPGRSPRGGRAPGPRSGDARPTAALMAGAPGTARAPSPGAATALCRMRKRTKRALSLSDARKMLDTARGEADSGSGTSASPWWTREASSSRWKGWTARPSRARRSPPGRRGPRPWFACPPRPSRTWEGSAGAPGHARQLRVQGGVPIQVEGEGVGAVGVSGVASYEDEQVARAGIAALG